MQRDFKEQVDRVNVMIDFDGDHRTGYDFTVSSTDGIYDGIITNEIHFNDDWDGNWRHAVGGDDDSWTAEVLIPWHIAPMREAAAARTLGIYVDRIVGATGERVAWPLASFERSRFLSNFAAIEVPNYRQSLFAVTPYVSSLHDFVKGGGSADGGVDVFWKPNGQMQLTATVNPDFGQVESDDLVVNFDATETFISDKRPFFTENQGIFEFNWAYRIEAEAFSGGLSGNHKLGHRVEVEPTYFISDAFNVYVGLQIERTPDWLVWQHDNLIGSFDGRQTDLNAGFHWTVTNRQELRLKLQAIGLTADLRHAYRVSAAGDAIPSAEPVDDFSVRNLGFQLRYRCELAPLSYLYIVYGRGGYEQEAGADDSSRLLRNSFRLRDDEQLLVKLSYRFES